MPAPIQTALSLLALTVVAPALAAQHEIHVIRGGIAGDALGTSASTAGDVNADGFDDFIVGAPLHDAGGTEAGRAVVFSGADGSTLHALNGAAAGDHFGSSVSGAGDVDGDGFGDFIVGAPDAAPNGAGSGTALVFSGADGSVLHTFSGALAGDRLGAAVGDAGDVDEDGYADLIVGAPGDDTGGQDAGQATVFSGLDGSMLHSFVGAAAGDGMGTSVAGAGDVNQDCAADVLVGAPGADFTAADAGRAYLFSGVDGSVIHTFDGDAAGDALGAAVGRAGDVDLDNVLDVIAGAPRADTGGSDAGLARVYSGATGLALLSFTGDAADDHFGASVSGIADANGDGYPDLIAGAPGDDAAGTDAGMIRLLSGRDGVTLLTVLGGAAGDLFGSAVDGHGDVDGDGHPDFTVGVPGESTVAAGSGGVIVLGTAPLDVHVEAASHDGTNAADEFGYAVNGAGDVDNDGVPDYIVGAPGDGVTPGATPYAVVFSGADHTVLRTLKGPFTGTQLGFSVAGCGDVNGDDHDDLIIGMPHDSAVATYSGRAVLVSGANQSILQQWVGAAAGDHLGHSVDGAGDVDNDGVNDVVIGVVAGKANRSGTVWVQSGADGSRLWTFDGLGPNDFYGWSVSRAGDINGDGHADVIASSRQVAQGIPIGPGYVHVWSGVDGTMLHNFVGDNIGDEFGRSVSGGVDLDADGVPDVIVGAPGDDNNGLASGHVRVFSGADGSVLHALDGEAAGDNFGWFVRGTGDVNGDGYDDFIVGAPGADPGGVIAAGKAYVFSGRDGSLIQSFDGTGIVDAFGHSVAGIGDINGDGLEDLIVGAYLADTTGPDAGNAKVFTSTTKTDPGSFWLYGPACPGSSGRLPRMRFTGRPVLGQSFGIGVTQGPPTALAALGLDSQQQSIELSFLGAPGCRILAMPAPALVLATDASGKASLNLPVPVEASLVGVDLYVQWVLGDGAANQLGFVFSNGGRITFGKP